MADNETLYLLLPDHHIYLCSDRDDGNFLADTFIKVWSRIPEKHQACMVKHWTGSQDPLNSRPLRILHLVDKCGTEKDTVAQTIEKGQRINFNRSWCGEAGIPDLLEPLVAHELAHVVLTATGESNHAELDRDGFLGVESSERRIIRQSELLTDDLSESWGFARKHNPRNLRA